MRSITHSYIHICTCPPPSLSHCLTCRRVGLGLCAHNCRVSPLQTVAFRAEDGLPRWSNRRREGAARLVVHCDRRNDLTSRQCAVHFPPLVLFLLVKTPTIIQCGQKQKCFRTRANLFDKSNHTRAGTE